MQPLPCSSVLHKPCQNAVQLGAPFPVRLEAQHVVDVQQQVWARAVARAPQGQVLQATYQHTSSPAFQQAVGSCLLAAAQAVPDGLLLFTPSYALLDKLRAAWQVGWRIDIGWHSAGLGHA